MVPPIGLATFAHDIREWYWDIDKWLDSLLNTLLMAYLATVLGTAIGGFLSFFAARNLARHYLTYWVTRRALEIARTVPDIVWALLFVHRLRHRPAGGHPGHHRAHDRRAGQAVRRGEREHQPAPDRRHPRGRRHLVPGDPLRRAAAGDARTTCRYTFWRLELNVRSATIVGFVGAGGIGHDLFTSIQLLYFADAGAILLIVVATIMLIDMLSEKFRHSAIGKASFAH